MHLRDHYIYSINKCIYIYILVFYYLHEFCLSISWQIPLTEGSLEVKLPTIWTDKKQRWEESEKRREEKKKENQKRESLRRKKIQVREKVGKSQNSVFFEWFVAPEGRKAAGAEPAGQMRGENLHPVVARSTFPSQKCKKKWQVRSIFCSCAVEKCMALWREAHLEVNCVKNWWVRSSFGSWDVKHCCGEAAEKTNGERWQLLQFPGPTSQLERTQKGLEWVDYVWQYWMPYIVYRLSRMVSES